MDAVMEPPPEDARPLPKDKSVLALDTTIDDEVDGAAAAATAAAAAAAAMALALGAAPKKKAFVPLQKKQAAAPAAAPAPASAPAAVEHSVAAAPAPKPFSLKNLAKKPVPAAKPAIKSSFSSSSTFDVLATTSAFAPAPDAAHDAAPDAAEPADVALIDAALADPASGDAAPDIALESLAPAPAPTKKAGVGFKPKAMLAALSKLALAEAGGVGAGLGPGAGEAADGGDDGSAKPPRKKKAKKAAAESGGDGAGAKPAAAPRKKATLKGPGAGAGGGTGTGGAKKPKAPKDPNAPKPTPSAYMLFCGEERAALKAAHPEASFGDLGRLMGEAWKVSGDDTKQRLAAKAKELKAVAAAEAPRAPVVSAAPGAGDRAADDDDADLMAAAPEAACSAAGGAADEGAGAPKKKKSAGFAPLKLVKSTAPMPAKKAPAASGKTKAKAAAVGAAALPLPSLSSSSSSALAASKSAKGKGKEEAKQKKRKRRSDDDGESDESGGNGAGDKDDADDYVVVRDPRAEALAAASERRAAGTAGVVKGGAIVEAGGYNADSILPHQTGRMNYAPFCFGVGDDVALVLPAFNDWVSDLEAARIPGGPDYGGLALAAEAASLLDVLACDEGPLAVTPLAPFYALTAAGALFGRVRSLARILVASPAPHAADADAGTEAAADGNDEGDEPPTKPAASAVRFKGRKLPPLAHFLLTLELDKAATRSGGFHLLPRSSGRLEEGTGGEIDDGNEGDGHRSGGGGDNEDDDVVVRSRPRHAPSSSSSSSSSSSAVTHPQLITIPWLHAAHALIDAPFVLRAEAYAAAEREPVLAGMQIRAMMPLIDDATNTKGEWFEGRAYATGARRCDVAAGWPRCLYKSVRVVWYEQDADTQEWFIDGRQSKNLQEPWRLVTKRLPFVTRENATIFVDESAPALGSPLEVLEHVRSFEAAGPFLKPVPRSETAYYARIRKPIDLGTMLKKAKAGAYDVCAGGGGPAALWGDFYQLLYNCKLFNEPVTSFWRQADMLEVEVRRVKKAYVGPTIAPPAAPAPWAATEAGETGVAAAEPAAAAAAAEEEEEAATEAAPAASSSSSSSSSSAAAASAAPAVDARSALFLSQGSFGSARDGLDLELDAAPDDVQLREATVAEPDDELLDDVEGGEALPPPPPPPPPPAAAKAGPRKKVGVPVGLGVRVGAKTKASEV